MLSMNWALLSAVVVMAIIALMYWRFEKGRSDAKEVALVATMAAIAGVSRVPFAVIMSFQPTTFIVMITGYVFGCQTGFVVGATAALISNFFLGQGPWTPWQMLSWGICGILGGLMGRGKEKFHVALFAVAGFFCGFLFGWLMNIWHWLGFVYPLNWQTFLATYIASFPFDALHGVGNALFTFLFGPSFYNILLRFRKKMYVDDQNEETSIDK